MTDSINLGGVGEMFGFGDGGDAIADASLAGAAYSANAQKDALAYLKETERLPQDIREKSLSGLAGLYGLEGYDSIDLVGQTRENPLYQALIEQIDLSVPRAEEALLRNASATGKLRGGDTIGALAEQAQNAQLAKSQALAQVYGQQVQGLQGLAKLPSNANNIANYTAGIGNTIGQGVIGSEQSRQSYQQAGFNNLLGLAQVGVGAAGASQGGAFSDIRLKDNVRLLGEVGGHRWYEWQWNDKARELGLDGRGEGVMAHEVADTHPQATGESNGYLTVNYDLLKVA